MKRVLLTLDNPSEMIKEDLQIMPYAILLLEKRVTETYTIQPQPKVLVEREKNGTISAYDRVPHTHHSYEQACISYGTKEDLDNNKGVYLDWIPEEADEFTYEYTATMVDM